MSIRRSPDVADAAMYTMPAQPLFAYAEFSQLVARPGASASTAAIVDHEQRPLPGAFGALRTSAPLSSEDFSVAIGPPKDGPAAVAGEHRGDDGELGPRCVADRRSWIGHGLPGKLAWLDGPSGAVMKNDVGPGSAGRKRRMKTACRVSAGMPSCDEGRNPGRGRHFSSNCSSPSVVVGSMVACRRLARRPEQQFVGRCGADRVLDPGGPSGVRPSADQSPSRPARSLSAVGEVGVDLLLVQLGLELHQELVDHAG